MENKSGLGVDFAIKVLLPALNSTGLDKVLGQI